MPGYLQYIQSLWRSLKCENIICKIRIPWQAITEDLPSHLRQVQAMKKITVKTSQREEKILMSFFKNQVDTRQMKYFCKFCCFLFFFTLSYFYIQCLQCHCFSENPSSQFRFQSEKELDQEIEGDSSTTQVSLKNIKTNLSGLYSVY